MNKFILALGLLFPLGTSAQTLTGKVSDSHKQPLVGASIYWLETNIATTTGPNGTFSIPALDHTGSKLVASYVGHTPDTMSVEEHVFIEFILQSSEDLEAVVIKGRRDGVIISNLNPIKVEQITQTELAKGACCDLAGCFGNQLSVQPQTTNIITNSKELRILGLSGVYNQVLIDGFPMIQGLSYTYGISSIPGTLLDNIYVAKGANSVLQGYESMSGQINVTTKDPDNTERLLLNVYMNSFSEKQLNANYAFKVGKWSNLTALHTVQPAKRTDGDKDDFLDLPLLNRYMLFSKWKYGNANEWGWNSTIGFRVLNEKRLGGQMSFEKESDLGSSDIYGQVVELTQPELWSKTGYRFDDNNNINFFVSAFYHDQNSFFGTTQYDAQQTNFYSTAQYERTYATHDIKSGISYRHLVQKEDIRFTQNALERTYAGLYRREEYIPGVFAENTMRLFNGRLTWIAGIRADHHNEFGWQVTPRSLVKYNFSPKAVVRANVGKGWRTVSLFSENINLLVSSRDIIIANSLEPEETLNFGFNFTQKFEVSSLVGYLSADYYRTNFQNQIFPDYDTDPTKAIIKNFSSKSVGQGFQAELFLTFREQFDFKVGYNYLDVYRDNGEVRHQLPFNAKHKVLSSFSYRPKNNRFHFDMNMHWFGKQRLPNTQTNPIEFQRPDFSDVYSILNAQFTYNFKKIEVYIGSENIFDFRQERPIISWQNPFGPYFDTSSVWGPVRGREFYIGLTYRLARAQ